MRLSSRGFGYALLLVAFWLAMPATASVIDELLAATLSAQADARESQRVVNRLDDEARGLRSDTTQADADSRYALERIAELESTASAQAFLIASLSERIAAIDADRQTLGPLLARMVDTLERFIALDLPFRLEERRLAVQALRDIERGTAVGAAEELQRILGAYMRELEYGFLVETYRAYLARGTRGTTVQYLRVGRLALYYLTLDGMSGALWDRPSRSWHDLSVEEVALLDRALRSTARGAGGEFLMLPLPEHGRELR